MSANVNAVFRREGDGGECGRRIAGVEAACDVGRRDERDHVGIGAGPFAEITVEVDEHDSFLFESG